MLSKWHVILKLVHFKLCSIELISIKLHNSVLLSLVTEKICISVITVPYLCTEIREPFLINDIGLIQVHFNFYFACAESDKASLFAFGTETLNKVYSANTPRK